MSADQRLSQALRRGVGQSYIVGRRPFEAAEVNMVTVSDVE